MATGAIASLLPKLYELLKEEYSLQKGVREKIESLSRELEVAQALLRKVGDVPWDQVNDLVRLWACDVKEASYDMEDIVDTFLVHVDAPEPTEPDPHVLRRLRKKLGILFKKSKARRKISIMIQDMNNKLKEVEARHAKGAVHKIANSLVAAITIDPRLENLYKRVTELVGIEGPRDELMDKLSIGGDGVIDKKMKIVSVVGVGGLGKTTLAKAVYEHLKPRFEHAAFVSVGQNPDVKKVLKNILTDLDKGKYMLWNTMDLAVMQLMDELKEFTKEKRYLIVIDDIWDKKSWKLIRCAFQESDCGSRVIITTRINEVAECASEVYKIQPLSPENSEKLLYARIQVVVQKYFDSPSNQACNKILKKCRGVPLAIITIASLLASKPSEYWFEVYNSIGFGHGDNEEVDNTRQILAFSYYDLPSHLKSCLLYLSIFPEDSKIKKNSLIWKWVAEGLIIISEDQEAQGVGLFELGEKYFYDLINRSMIQPQESNPDYRGYVDACSVHDMVLDLIHSISSNEHFVTVLRGNEKLPRSIVRRLALQKADVHISGGQVANNNITVEKARSLIADGCKFHVPSCSHLPVLRVLDMTNSDVEEDCDEGLLDGLGSLLRLRYLRVQDDSKECIIELPKEVRYLKYLQILDLSQSYGIKELPEEVGLLTQLVCLRLSYALRIVPAGLIGKLTSLQELKISWPQSATTMQFVKELGSLRELRVLYCCIKDGTESVTRALLESLGNLHNIRELTIANPRWIGMSHAGFINCQHLRFLGLYGTRFSALPPWIKPSLAPNLSFLAVRILVVNEQDMETLARLPELRSLCLFSEGDTKLVIVNIKIHTEGVAYFSKLRSLKIHGTSILFRLHGGECNNSRITTTVMPSLESLEIDVHVRYLKEHGFDKVIRFDNLGRTSLQRVTARVHCGGARVEQVVEAQAALRHAAADHPEHPTLRTILFDKNEMVSPYQEAYMDAKRNPELLVNKGWKKSADIVRSGHTRALCLPDASTSSSKVMCLLYTNEGDRLLALSSNAAHKLWKWEHGDEGIPWVKASTSIPPQLWQPEDGIAMTNDTANGNPEAAAACMAVVRVRDFYSDYLFSASGGTLSVFNIYASMVKDDTFMQPLPPATFVAFCQHNEITVAIGMDDCSIEIFYISRGVYLDMRPAERKVIAVLRSHQKKITGLAFSKSEKVLVSSDFDAQLCAWSMKDWEKTNSKYIQPPCNCSGALLGDTTVQFHYDETHILVVHKTQLAIYDSKLECLCSWLPKDALPDPISSAVYSSDGLLVYAGFCDGAIGIFEADSLTLQCRISRSAYIPSSVSSGGGNVYPTAVAANPWKPNQMAVGLSDGAVYVLEPPLDSDVTVGSDVSSGQRLPCGSSSCSGAGQQDV